MRNNWPLIKVCGIQTVDEAILAAKSGANTIGLLLGLTHRAEDKIDAERGAGITRFMRDAFPDVRIVMVTHLLVPMEVERIAKGVGVDAIQIHDDMTAENVGHLRTRMPGVEIFKAIHIDGAGPEAVSRVVAKAAEYAPYVDAFFTDSKSVDPDGAVRIGGTGKRHDPNVARLLIEAFPEKPVVLAGGLNPGNVAQAIQDVCPAGIDANSGLENERSEKDFEKMVAFAVAGRNYL